MDLSHSYPVARNSYVTHANPNPGAADRRNVPITLSNSPRIVPGDLQGAAVRPHAARSIRSVSPDRPDTPSLRNMLRMRKGLAAHSAVLDEAQRVAHGDAWHLMWEPDSQVLQLAPPIEDGDGGRTLSFAISSEHHRVRDMDGSLRLPRNQDEHEYVVNVSTNRANWAHTMTVHSPGMEDFQVTYGPSFSKRGLVLQEDLLPEQVAVQEHVWQLIEGASPEVYVVEERQGEIQTITTMALYEPGHRVIRAETQQAAQPLYLVTTWHGHGAVEAMLVESRASPTFLASYGQPARIDNLSGVAQLKVLKMDLRNHKAFKHYVAQGRCVRADRSVVPSLQAFQALPLPEQRHLVKMAQEQGLWGTLQAIDRVEQRPRHRRLTEPSAWSQEPVLQWTLPVVHNVPNVQEFAHVPQAMPPGAFEGVPGMYAYAQGMSSGATVRTPGVEDFIPYEQERSTTNAQPQHVAGSQVSGEWLGYLSSGQCTLPDGRPITTVEDFNAQPPQLQRQLRHIFDIRMNITRSLQAPEPEPARDAIFIPASPGSRGEHVEDERYRW